MEYPFSHEREHEYRHQVGKENLIVEKLTNAESNSKARSL